MPNYKPAGSIMAINPITDTWLGCDKNH